MPTPKKRTRKAVTKTVVLPEEVETPVKDVELVKEIDAPAVVEGLTEKQYLEQNPRTEGNVISN